MISCVDGIGCRHVSRYLVKDHELRGGAELIDQLADVGGEGQVIRLLSIVESDGIDREQGIR